MRVRSRRGPRPARAPDPFPRSARNDRITATGNIAGASAGDLVARDRDGVLWLHLGRGDGAFAPRTRIGGGWNVYRDLVGMGADDRDGRADLYAARPGERPEGFVHPGTGDWRRPFTAALQVGSGFRNFRTYDLYI